MITEIRRHLKASKTTSFVGFLTVLALGGFFSIPMLLRQASSKGPWAIRVSGSEISYKEFSNEVAIQQENINRFRAQYGQFADMLFQMHGMSINPQVLAQDLLIKQELLLQLAHACGIQITRDYIVEKINDKEFVSRFLKDILPPYVFDQSGFINQDSLRMYLKHQGLSMNAFEEKIVQSLYRAIVISFIDASLYTPNYDAEYVARLTEATKKYTIVQLRLEDYVKKDKADSPATKEDVQAYYDARNAAEKKYWVPEKRTGTAWTFTAKAYDIKITDDMINAYYEDHKTARFADKPAQVEVRYLVVARDFQGEDGLDAQQYLSKKRDELLQNPSQFASVAKEISIDPSAKNGGLLKPFSRGEQDVVIERAAFVLQQDGDISPVLETKDGYALVQRVSKKQRTFKPLESVRADIKKALIDSEFKDLFVKDIKVILDMQDQAERTAALEQFIAQRKGTKEQVSAQLESTTPFTKRLFDIAIHDVTFVAEKEKGTLLRLDTIDQASLPALSTIYDVVLNDLHEERAYKKMKQDVFEIKTAMKNQSLKDLSDKYLLTYTNVDWNEKDAPKGKDKQKGTVFDEFGIPVSDVKGLEVLGGSIVHQEDRSFAIIRLDALDSSSKKLDPEVIQKSKKILDQEYMHLMVEGLVASLYRNATIETNKEVTFQAEDLLYE